MRAAGPTCLVDRVGQELLPIDVALVLVLVLVLLALARLILVILVLVQLVLVILVLILLVILLAPRHPPAYRALVEAFPRRPAASPLSARKGTANPGAPRRILIIAS